MTTEEQKNLRTYCAFLLEEHGIFFPPDDPVIPALYVIYMHMKSTDQSNQVLTHQIHEALKKINPKEFHFHHPGEAWKFQMAVALKWTIGISLVFASIFIGTWHWSNINDIDSAKSILQSSDNVSKLLHRVHRNREGSYFIDFTAGAGDSIQHFIEYERLDRKTVRVYVGKE